MLNALFKPQTIAVYGASRDPNKLGHVIVSNIVSGGFTGTLVPINPNVSEISGLRCYPSAREFDGTLDLALVAVPAPQVRDAVADAAIRGVKTVAVVSTGFKGSGPEGDRLEAELVAYCQDRGIRLLGPSCLGVINPHLSLNASVSAVNPRPGGIGFISQSGALCASFLDWIHGRHLGISKLVCIGNRADIDETDLIQHYAADPDTRVIVAYLENIAAGEEFLRIAEGAASVKPLVILKAGITEAGVQAAASHTGRTAEMNIAYGAAFRRSGVVRAQSYGELIDFAKTFAMAPLPAGDRVAIVSNAGGSGILAADAVERFGLTVAQLPAAERARLALQADESGHPSPVHLLGEADPEHYAEVVRALQASDAVDSILVVLTPQAMARPAETARAIAERATGVKPMLFSFMGGSRMMPGREELVARGLPDFNTPERAARSLKALGV